VIAALFGSVGAGFGECFASPKQCSDSELCHWATTNGYDSYTKKTAKNWELISDWRQHINEAKRRGLTCGVKPKTEASPSPLKVAFKKLSQDKRKQVQSNLKDLGYYKSSIDGLYGEGTAGALTAYNKQHLGGADLKKSANAEKLIKTVLALKPAPKPITPASPAQPKDTYKVASGTGFYVSDQGHIITNHHVIDGCKNMKVHSKGKVLHRDTQDCIR